MHNESRPEAPCGCWWSAPASPVSAWRSACDRQASTIIWSWKGRRCRRLLAGKPLPGRRLRRPLASLFVFLRAEGRLVAQVRPAGGNPRLPAALRGQVPSAREDPFPLRGGGGPFRRRQRRMAGALRRWPDAARTGPGLRHRPVEPAAAAAPARPGALPGSGVPLGELGRRGRAGRQAGRGDRHRSQRHPVRPADRPQVQRLSLFQRSAPYVIAKPDRTYADWERRLKARWPWLQRLDRGSSTCTTNRGCSPSRPSRR